MSAGTVHWQVDVGLAERKDGRRYSRPLMAGDQEQRQTQLRGVDISRPVGLFQSYRNVLAGIVLNCLNAARDIFPRDNGSGAQSGLGDLSSGRYRRQTAEDDSLDTGAVR